MALLCTHGHSPRARSFTPPQPRDALFPVRPLDVFLHPLPLNLL